jgi:hypothetical protein
MASLYSYVSGDSVEMTDCPRVQVLGRAFKVLHFAGIQEAPPQHFYLRQAVGYKACHQS